MVKRGKMRNILGLNDGVEQEHNGNKRVAAQSTYPISDLLLHYLQAQTYYFPSVFVVSFIFCCAPLYFDGFSVTVCFDSSVFGSSSVGFYLWLL